MKTARPDRKTLLELYDGQVLSPEQIAARYNVRPSIVLDWLRVYGIPRRRSDKHRRSKAPSA